MEQAILPYSVRLDSHRAQRLWHVLFDSVLAAILSSSLSEYFNEQFCLNLRLNALESQLLHVCEAKLIGYNLSGNANVKYKETWKNRIRSRPINVGIKGRNTGLRHYVPGCLSIIDRLENTRKIPRLFGMFPVAAAINRFCESRFFCIKSLFWKVSSRIA